MMTRYLRTSDIAETVGVHPNTVRLYEAWGFLPPIPRSASGYRLFTAAHLDQMRLARTALCGPYPGGKSLVVDLVQRAAAGDLGGALELAYAYLARLRAEQAQAEAAAELLERWAQGTAALLAFTGLIFWSLGFLFTWLFNSIFQMARYPVGLYPGWLCLVLTWVVPVGVMTTVPAQALTGELSAGMLIGSAAMATALLVGASALFRFGLRRYASASS
jgi:hypothetical protein